MRNTYILIVKKRREMIIKRIVGDEMRRLIGHWWDAMPNNRACDGKATNLHQSSPDPTSGPSSSVGPPKSDVGPRVNRTAGSEGKKSPSGRRGHVTAREAHVSAIACGAPPPQKVTPRNVESSLSSSILCGDRSRACPCPTSHIDFFSLLFWEISFFFFFKNLTVTILVYQNLVKSYKFKVFLCFLSIIYLYFKLYIIEFIFTRDNFEVK